MSAKYCAVNTTKWKELAGQTSEDVVITRYAITGQQDLESVYAPVDTVYDSILTDGKIDVTKLNGYNVMHQTSHFKMEITNAKGETREVLVINPIPSSFASIGGNNITKEKIDNNPYITVRKGSESGREYYYASFAGYTTLQNLNDSLRRDGLATEGSVFNSDIVLDENIIKEKANSLETKVKFFSERFDDAVVKDIDIENVSKVTGKDKKRLEYLFGASVSKLIDLKTKYRQDIAKFNSLYNKTQDPSKKQYYLDRTNELEGDIVDIDNLIKQLTEQKVYELSDRLKAFGSAIELSESKVGTIVNQIKRSSKRLKEKLGHKNGGIIKAIDYVRNNESGLIPAEQLSILSKQQHLLSLYTNLNEIKESISILKNNISEQLNKYENNKEAIAYLNSLDSLLNDMMVKIEDIEKSKKGVDSELDHMIRETTIALLASNNTEAQVRWQSLMFDKFKKEAEDQYRKDLEVMSEKKAKDKYNKTIEKHKLWEKAFDEAAKDTPEKIEYIFKKSEQEVTEIDDISALHAYISQQGRISDIASQMIFNIFSMIEQNTRTQYMDDINKKGGLLDIQKAFKKAGLNVSNFKDIITERKYTDEEGNEKTRYIIKPIFKEDTTNKYNELRERLKILKSELNDLYEQDSSIQDIEAQIYAQEGIISVTRNLINKVETVEERTEYKKKYDITQQELNLLKQKLQEAKDKINSKSELYKEVSKLEKELNDYKKLLIEAADAVEKYYNDEKSDLINKYKELLDLDIVDNYNLFRAVYMVSKGLFDMEQRVAYSLQNLSHKSKIYNVTTTDSETGKSKIDRIRDDSTVNFLMDEVVLPKVEASKIEILKNRGAKNLAEQAWSDFTKIQESEKAEGIAIEFDIDVNGDPIKRIRRNYLYPLEDGVQQSFDLLNLYALESIAVNRYKNRVDAKDELETITGVINSRNVHKKRGFKDIISKTKFGGYAQKIFKSKDETPNVNKVINAMMDAHLYGAQVQSTGIKVLDKLLTQITGMTALTGYVANVFSATANFFVGTIDNFTEVFGQEYFTFKDSRLASYKLVGFLKQYYSTSFDLVDNSFLGVLFKELNLQGGFNKKFNFESKYDTKFQEMILNPSRWFEEITSQSEFFTQAPLAIAIVQGIKITNKNGEYLDKDGNVVKDRDKAQSLLDIMYVKDGKLAFKKDLKDLYLSQNLTKYNDSISAGNILWSGGEENILKNSLSKYIEDIMFKTQGMYNSFNSPLAKMNIYLMPLFQYRMFMDEKARRMYAGITTLAQDLNNPELHGGRYFNPHTKRPESGMLTSVLQWWLTRPSNHTLIKNLVIKGLNKINNTASKINQEITNEASWNRLTDHQQADVARFMYYAAINVSLFVIALILKAIKDEDLDDENVDRITLLVKRMQNEIMFVWNPSEFLQFFSNPAASVRTIQLISSWTNTLLWTASEFALTGEVIEGRYKVGEHKGDLKLYHKTLELLPYASFIKFFKDENYVQDRLKFYEKTY